MKRLSYILILFAPLFTLASCSKNPTPSSIVRFRIASTESTVSKTSYSGDINQDGLERIDWTSGDLIRIFCAAAREPSGKYSDYLVTNVTAEGARSLASIEAKDGEGLRWGIGEHIFYAVSPSPSGDGKSSINNGIISGTIASEQYPITLKTSIDGTLEAIPDMMSQYMAAKVSALPRSIRNDEVALSFIPLTTSARFTIVNGLGNGEDMTIKAISLLSPTTDISGRFTTDLTLWDGVQRYPSCTAGGDNGRKVTIDFSSLPDDCGELPQGRGIILSNGRSLCFTLFLLPLAQVTDDIVFQIELSDGSLLSAPLVDSSGKGISFPRCKKKVIEGILVREGIKWKVSFNDATNVLPWENEESFATAE
ncbi:MAG: hypothetical protein KBT00_02925 [Bacteroidales bacterium]|nr:hypothetical protein [Candidatus Cacconaster merdequi]